MTSFAKATRATVIPTLRYRDAAAAVDWLCTAFGFERHLVVTGEGGAIDHAQLVFGNGMVMLGSARDDEFGQLQQPLAQAGGPVSQSPYLVVSDVDAHHAKAVAAGAQTVMAPEDQHYGGRLYSCRDPEGNLWNFGSYDPWDAGPARGTAAPPRRAEESRRSGRMRGGSGSALPKRAALPLFVAALMLTAFAGGLYVARHEVFPYALLSDAYKTFAAAVDIHLREAPSWRRWEFADIPPDQAAARRFEFIGSDRLTDPILVPGGRGHFREYCPDHVGCLAVEYAGRGEVRHAWPYRPDELEKWMEKGESVVDFPYERAPGFSLLDHTSVIGVSSYANGDLMVVFRFRHTHPYGGGLARIDRTGKPVWYRPDFSHHRPHLTDGEVVLVPGQRLGKAVDTELVPGRDDIRLRMSCPQWPRDLVNVIDEGGERLKEVSVFDAVIESPYAPLLLHVVPCNPTHVNSVHPLGEDAAGPGLEPGDLVVSMRNLHAFAVLDRETHRLKRMVRGGFMSQHAVLHLGGSRFLLLDNQGGRTADGALGVSRLLMVDAASGEETTIFPNHRTPGHLRDLYTSGSGGVAISPDRRRALATFTQEGKAVEVRIADGAVLAVFHSLHDMSHVEELPEERATRAMWNRLNEVRYGGDG